MTNTESPTLRPLPLDPAATRRPADLGRAERDAEIVRRRSMGESLESIGSDFGLTRERVRQIAKAGGCPGRSGMKRLRAERRQQESQVLRQRCLAHLDRQPGSTADGLARDLGVPRARILAALGRDGRRLLGLEPRPGIRVSDAGLLGELQLAAELIRGPLTGAAYDRIERALGLHSRVLMLQRFGTWRDACALAGVTPGEPWRRTYTRRWTREDMVTWVALYLADPSSRGTYAGYDQFARDNEGAPGAQTVRNAIGSWATIKAEALRMLAGAPEPLAGASTMATRVGLGRTPGVGGPGHVRVA